MIGAKVDIKAYKAKVETRKRFSGFTGEEIYLTHYNGLKSEYKKIA